MVKKIALVGYNGAGKTTIVKLISGFYHPTKGQILINGKDIETLKREEIDKLISSSYQESFEPSIFYWRKRSYASKEGNRL